MAFVDDAARELVIKIAYFGPGLAGCTTSMRSAHADAPEASRTPLERRRDVVGELGFSAAPTWVAPVRGRRVRLSVHAAIGALYIPEARQHVLAGVDAVVFVVDSQVERMEANAECLADLARRVASLGRSLDAVPLVFQYNKRDLPSALPVADLDAALNAEGRPRLETVAARGVGVLQALRAATWLALGAAAR